MHNLATGPPGLLRASRQIRSEASQIYYLENTFCFVESSLDEEAIARFFDQVDRLSTKFLHAEIFRHNREYLHSNTNEMRIADLGRNPS